MSRERYDLLDTVRGVLIINMILYHALYDVVHIMGIPIGWYTGPAGYIWQQNICWGFILLSGFCFRLSRRPLRHGLTVLGAGILVTLATALASPQSALYSGCSTCWGSAHWCSARYGLCGAGWTCRPSLRAWALPSRRWHSFSPERSPPAISASRA